MTEEFSLQVSRALNDLGFDEETRHYRIDQYGEQNFVRSVCSHRLEMWSLLSGSKAEGTSKYQESDFDFLDVYSDVKATECVDLVQGDNDLILLMEDSAPPGYCKLQLLQCSWNFCHLDFLNYDCYVRCPGQRSPHLSSSAVVQMDHITLPTAIEKSGPSNKGQPPGCLEMDNVQAIRCAHMPLSLKNWITRHEDKNWPTKQIMEEITRSDIFVVPVGMHGTEQRHLQWRVSFNIPEKILIQNFTSVQYKIYVLLKMIKTEIIQPHCPESVTPYIVKTLMLWAVEEIPERLWSERKLIDLLFFMLHMLYKCIQHGYCPMYFIPECNILQGRVTRTTQLMICEILCALMSDRTLCIWRLPSVMTKLYEYTFVPLAFRVFNRHEKEKTNIALSLARQVHVASLEITNRVSLLYCLQEQVRIPYEDLLIDLVAVPTPVESERKKLVKYIFRQTLSQLAQQQFVDVYTKDGNNTEKYRRVRKCVKILHGNHSIDILCVRVRLAQVLCMIGQNAASKDILESGANRIRYYTYKGNERMIMHHPVIELKLKNVCENGCLSTSRFLKKFLLSDVQYDHQMEVCLPKALQYENYNTINGIKRPLNIDSETLLYYFQYLCHEQLGQRNNANVAFTNLVRCATTAESNIEYREKSLNVLGHCLIKKKLYDKAARVLVNCVMLVYNQFQHQHMQRYLEAEHFRPYITMLHIAILLNKVHRNS